MTSTASTPVVSALPTPREHLTSPITRSVLRVQQRLLAAAREFLAGEGFVEMLPPIIGPVTDPGVRGAKQIDVDYYGHRYKLMTSSILYKQASLLAFDRIFYVAPNVRLEPLETAVTHRHLAEFHQLDVEMAGASRDDVLAIAEGLVGFVAERIAGGFTDELAELGREPDALRAVGAAPFDRITHEEAVAQLRDLDHPQSSDAEIDWVGEELLSRERPRPFFVVDYPKGSRGFYDRESRTEAGVLRNFDLIMPEGYGELASGSEREYDYARLITRMRETGENPAKYQWYLDVARDGIPPSAGFGIGVERFTRFLTGLDAAWRSCAFPKIPGVVSP